MHSEGTPGAFAYEKALLPASMRQAGENRQEFFLPRWPATSMKLLLLNKPTEGIEVQAARDRSLFLDTPAPQELAVLGISTECLRPWQCRIFASYEGHTKAGFSGRQSHRAVAEATPPPDSQTPRGWFTGPGAGSQ